MKRARVVCSLAKARLGYRRTAYTTVEEMEKVIEVLDDRCERYTSARLTRSVF